MEKKYFVTNVYSRKPNKKAEELYNAVKGWADKLVSVDPEVLFQWLSNFACSLNQNYKRSKTYECRKNNYDRFTNSINLSVYDGTGEAVLTVTLRGVKGEIESEEDI